MDTDEDIYGKYTLVVMQMKAFPDAYRPEAKTRYLQHIDDDIKRLEKQMQQALAAHATITDALSVALDEASTG